VWKNNRVFNHNLKIAFIVNIERHLLRVARVYRFQTQELREDMIDRLKGIFQMAVSIAKSKHARALWLF
jgi:hypothetical protein